MQLKGSTCEICGKAILSKTGKATLCMDKSTCRVAKARKQKKAQKEAEKMMVSTETFALYQTIITVCPSAKIDLDVLLSEYGKGAFASALTIASFVLHDSRISEARAEMENAL